MLIQTNQSIQRQPDSLLKATGLLSLGNALREIGDLDQKNPKATEITRIGSQQALEQALEVAKRVKSPETVAQIQLSLGNTAQALQKTEAALEFYQQAATTSSSPITQIQAKLNQLSLLVSQEQLSDAQKLWPSIQSELATLEPSRKTAYAYLNLAQSLKIINQSVKSSDSPSSSAIAQLVSTAVQQAKSLKDPRAEAYALGTLGGLYVQTQQWSIAQDLTQKALLLAEATEAPDIAYRWQWQLGRILKAPENPQANTTAAIASYSKAVNILKSLRNDLVAINPDIQFSFQEEVEPVYRELVSLLLQTKNDAQDNIQQARDVIESLRLAEIENFLRQACLDNKPVQIDQIDRTAAVIYPIILKDRLEVILSLPNQPLRHYSTSIADSQVKSTLDQLSETLSTPPTSVDSREFLPSLQQVYSWLIQPVEADLQKSKIKTLVFVLDGPMRNVPMAALYDGQQYLVEKYSIALNPGLQLLNLQKAERGSLKALLAGLSEQRPNEPEFGALPNVPKELKEIREEIPSRVLLNPQFTSEAFEQEISASSAPIVHLATHGQFSSQAEDTFILAWNKRINVNEFSTLLQNRTSARDNAIDLLVLSACETAKGDDRAALGIAGTAVRAGARSTLATLWQVADEPTSVLMADFYQELAKTPVSKAEALRHAQQVILKDPKSKHPYFWAPYVLVGNWL